MRLLASLMQLPRYVIGIRLKNSSQNTNSQAKVRKIRTLGFSVPHGFRLKTARKAQKIGVQADIAPNVLGVN